MIKTLKFSEIVDTIAKDYAIGHIRDLQRFANNRGSTLSAEDLVEKFNEAYAYMHDRIQGTTQTTTEGELITTPELPATRTKFRRFT